MNIVKVNHGIANNFGDYIEVNKHLYNHPGLLEPILAHELQHTNKTISVQDFKIDFMNSTNVNQWQLIKFMFKHPLSFTQLLPIYFTRKKGFVIDYNLMVMYLIMSFVFFGTVYVGAKFI